MPSVNIQNSIPNVRTGNTALSVAISEGPAQTTDSSTMRSFGGKGYLIGMLGLTYISAQTSGQPTTSGGRGKGPTVRVQQYV